MIILSEEQFDSICPKHNVLGQCDWFREKYGCTLLVNRNFHKNTYKLTFRTEKEETFFRIQYSDVI